MAQSEKQRRREMARYSLAGLAAWLPIILAKDIIHQHVPAALETPFLAVAVTGFCLLGLAGFREGVYNSRPNRSALLIGLSGGGLFFSLSLAFLHKEMGQVCGVFFAFGVVMMAAAVQSSSKLNARFRASFPAPAAPAPVLSGEMRHFLEESAINDPDAYVIYPDRAGMGPAYRQAPYLMLSRVGLVDFPGTSPFVNIPADMLSVPLEDILAAVPRYTSLLASAQDGARLARMPAATQLPTTSQHKQEAEEDGG